MDLNRISRNIPDPLRGSDIPWEENRERNQSERVYSAPGSWTVYDNSPYIGKYTKKGAKMRLSDAARAGRGGPLPLAGARVPGQGAKAAQRALRGAPTTYETGRMAGGAA